MKSKARILIFAMMLLLGAALAGQAEDAPQSASPSPQPVASSVVPLIPLETSSMTRLAVGKVKDVLKSDMIMLQDDRRYRLDSVRVPPYEDVATKEELKRFIQGKDVILYTYPSTANLQDRYGLPLVQAVTGDGIWLQDYMISKGLMWAYSSETSPQTVDILKLVEEKAREAGVGFWKNPAYAIKTPESAADFIDSYQIVEGKILNVSTRTGTVFFNFGKDWKTDFTVKMKVSFTVLPPREKSLLRGLMEPQVWRNKTVRVRGWVVRNGGPLIEVENWQQIDLVPSSKAKK